MSEIKNVLSAIPAELAACLGRVDENEVARAVDALASAPRIFVAGAGRSGLATRGFAMRLMHMGKQVYIVGDTTTPGIASGDLLVIGSGSGRTASLLGAATKAKDLGASVALF